MPIKTDFLALNKVQVNEYYNCDIENDNLDKIDNKLKNHEERTVAIEEKIHKKDDLSIELSSMNRIISVTDSFGGACGYEIQGSLTEQLIKNGDFDKNIDRWSTGTMSGHIDMKWIDGVLRTTGKSDSIAGYMHPEPVPFKPELNQKYFVHCSFRNNTQDGTGFDIGLYKNPSSSQGDRTIGIGEIPVANQWYDISGSITVTQNVSSECYFYPVARYMGDGKTIANRSTDYKNIMCIPLKNEDLNLSIDQLKEKYIENGYFEGLQPTRGVTIKSVGRNLFDKSKVNRGNALNSLGNLVNNQDYAVSSYTRVESNCSYYKSSTYYVAQYDGQFNFISNIRGGLNTFTTDSNCKYIKYSMDNSDCSIDLFMLTKGVTQPSNYIPYISVKKVIADPLTQWDKIIYDKATNKLIKWAKSNIGLKGSFFKPTAEMININTAVKNVNHVYFSISEMKGIIPHEHNYTGSDFVYVEGFKKLHDPSKYMDLDCVGCYYINSAHLVLLVDKMLCPDPQTAKLLYGDKLKIAYKISEPQEIYLSDKLELINSYNDYSQFDISDGVVEREKANPVLYSNVYHIDNPDLSESLLRFKSLKYNSIYEISNGRKKEITDLLNVDNTISFNKSVVDAFDIDINQLYVDYVTSETCGQAKINLTYNADLTSTINSNSNSLHAISKQIDINTETVDRLGKPLNWIEPTLLNGWRNRGVNDHTVQYAKDSLGWVHIRGTVVSGTLGETLFRLPEGFRPTKTEYVGAISAKENAYMYILATGEVTLQTGSTIWYDVSYSYYIGV